MKVVSSVVILSVAAAAHAHSDRVGNVARQAAVSSSGAPTAIVSSGAPAATVSAVAPAATASSAVLAGPVVPQQSYSFTLQATNPTAVPLSQIVSNAATATTRAVPTPAVAGTKPSYLSNAPALPDISKLVIANYPPLDKVPPTDSPEVKAWLEEVKNSGVKIPTFSPTTPGVGCAGNPQAVAEEGTRCWWSCSGCVRTTDVTSCPNKLTWGLTFDDGPSPYTPDLLQYLDEVKIKATLFVVGSRALANPATLQASYMAGHQIAVHTWAHGILTTYTNEQIVAELGWGRKIIKDVLGVTPTQMRPPTGDIDDRVRAISIAMGLTPVMWTRISPTATFDTEDFNIHNGLATVDKVLSNWNHIIGNATTMDTGFITLEHDLYQQTVEVSTGYILPDAIAHNPKFTIEPVITCLGRPMSAAYIETNDNKTNPPLASGGVVVNTGTRTAGGAQSTNAPSAAWSRFETSMVAVTAAAGLIAAALAF